MDSNDAKEDLVVVPSDEQLAVKENDERYITGKRLVLVFSGFMLSVLLVALDQTIVATALPRIISHFNGLSAISWVPNAYLLTQGSLMLPIGRFLTMVPMKYVLLASIAVFELGSLLCAVAPTLSTLIGGRAVAGSGAAGVMISIISIIAQIARLETRPMLFGLCGSVYALASVIGPLIGGALTARVSWRWCFYINLPLGAVALVAVAFFLDARPPLGLPNQHQQTTLQKWLRVDWIGTVLCLGTVTTFLLPLQWGGATKPWSSPSVIALFCVSFVLFVAFVLWEKKVGPERAILPLKMWKRRTQVGAAGQAFWIMCGLLVGTYYLPLWYQAKGRSPVQSGIDILPFMLAVVITALGSGICINATGQYWPFLFGSPLVFAVGAGLLYTIDVNTSTARLIGYQIIYGMGLGACMQNTDIAVQAEYADDEKMIPQASSILSFTELMGGIVGLAVAGSVFVNQLSRNLAVYAPDLSPELVAGVQQSVSFIFTLPEAQQTEVIRAYIKSLDPIFLIGVPAGALATIFSLLVKSHNLKERSNLGRAEDAGSATEVPKVEGVSP